jgi:hypothetical protein
MPDVEKRRRAELIVDSSQSFDQSPRALRDKPALADITNEGFRVTGVQRKA